MNQDEGFLSTRHDFGEEVMVIKPSCNYHFWCLWLEKNKNFWGCIKRFLKYLRSKLFFAKSWIKNFEKFIVLKTFFIKLYFSTLNINLEWFQLSFDVYIVSIGDKLYIFKNVLKAENLMSSDEVIFGTTFWKHCKSKDGFQRF